MDIGKIDSVVKSIKDNGKANMGLAAGTDMILSNDKKLAVYTNAKNLTEYITYAFSHLTAHNVSDPRCKVLTCAAVHAVFQYGLIRLDKLDLDCKPVLIKGSNTEIAQYTDEDVTLALDLIIASKISFYSTNHHTGQGGKNGYINRVILTRAREADFSILVTMIHMISHWANTSIVYCKLGFDTKLKYVSIEGASDLVCTDDIRVRMNTVPAGTAKLGLSYSILRRLMNTELLAFVPCIEDLKLVTKMYKDVMQNRFRYHLNSKAITGEERLEYEDSNFDRALAVLATYNKRVNATSSINNSPIISGVTGERYRELDGYDATFDKVCVAYVRSQSAVNERAMAIFGEISSIDIKAKLAENKKIITGSEDAVDVGDTQVIDDADELDGIMNKRVKRAGTGKRK